MNLTNIPSSFANAVSPFNPVGKQTVGQESPDSKNSSFKAVEESAESSRTENRKSEKSQDNNLTKEAIDEKASKDEGKNPKQQDSKEAAQERAVKNRELQDQEEIRQLAARDREVRNHERAHAAVGGQYAGAPTYTYERGPNGVNYAVGGEVAIETGAASDPRATIQKAQQIRRAALAPAEPSPQDRRVAAAAMQLEMQARADLAATQLQEQQASKAQFAEQRAQQERDKEEREIRARALADEEHVREVAFAENSRRTVQLNQRLIDIGIEAPTNPTGQYVVASA